LANKASLPFKPLSATAAPRGDLRGYRSPLQQQQRPDYLKLILLLAMIFLPWVAIGYVAWLVSTSP
jgi:hypothetical protein